MAIETVPRSFSFSFSDLAGAHELPCLRVMEPEAAPAPGEAFLVEPFPRPRWLPRLLPVFRSSEPLQVHLRSAAAPAFGARLLASLAGLFASAGDAAGVRVGTWDGGFVVAGHAVHRSEAAHAEIVVAELEPASVAAATAALAELSQETRWLVLHGDLPALDRVLGLEAALGRVAPDHLVRLPLVERGDLAAAARGLAPGLGRRRTGLAHLELARRLVSVYLSMQP